MRDIRFFLSVVVGLALGASARADPVKFQVTGLFSPDRVDDLREVVSEIANVKLVGVDFKNAEASFEFDPAKAFPGAKPEQIVQRLDSLVKNASRSTFGVKPLRAQPLDKLTRIDIDVLGLDCKACSFAAYESVFKLEGVEQATASFREGKVTAWIDASKTNRAVLEAALKKKGVTLKTP